MGARTIPSRESALRRGTPLPPNFKLHCNELRQNAHPHDQISRQECRDLADVVFGAMRSIGCSLVSATAYKPSHTSKYPQYGSAGARTLLVRLERFGYFLGDRGDGGRVVYERFAAGLRKRTGGESRVLRSASAFPHFANPDKIKGRMVDGDPTIRVVPQFSDFFARAPHIKMVAGHRRSSRWDETKDKHYCVDGPRNGRGFVVI